MSTSLYSFKVIVKLIEQWAQSHVQLNRFTFGTIQEADIGKSCTYPWMHLAPNNISYDDGARTMTLDIMVADLVKDKESKSDSELDVINNCHYIVEDLINTLENSQQFGDNVILNKPITVTPFFNDFTNNLSGVETSISFELDYQFNFCESDDLLEPETISVYSQVIDFEAYPVYNSIRYLCDGDQVAVCYSPGGEDNIPALVALFNSNPGTGPSCENPEVCFCWSNYGTYYDNGDGRIRCEMPIAIANQLCATGELTLDIIRD